MKNITILISSLATLLLYSTAFAVGGKGATCNPSTDNWGSCDLAPVPFAAFVTKTINISSGNYETPYQANQANTRYLLQGNITANGTAIVVGANYVIIDLNGYTITYNQTTPGEGVTIEGSNYHHISIRNGSILQGSALSEGDQYGSFNNPVSTCNTTLGICKATHYSHIANLYIKYGGRDITGFKWTGNDILVEQNTVEDDYEFGTLKNRHQGINALWGGDRAIIRNNTLVNARHRGIQTDNDSQIYGNFITTRGIATNGYGIFGYNSTGVTAHSNTIIGRGQHPIGIGYVSDASENNEVYNNYIDVKTTAIGEEYSSEYLANPKAVINGNSAAGFRTTWGANNLNVHDNEIHVASDSNLVGTYSPTGATAYINAGGKGLFAGTTVGDTVKFTNNLISVLDKDGTGRAYGITCAANESDKLYFLNNTVTSNIANVVVSDEYDKCGGYPLFQGNIFIKSGNHANYTTLTNQNNGYFLTTARFVENIYQNGAAENSINFHPAGSRPVDIYFGSVINNEYRYKFRLHDNNGLSSTLLRDDYNPATTLGYSHPVYAQTPPVINKIILQH